ncbi:sigma-70 family RNA polymerase sigma factor [Lysinibacillus capsici]|uniref:sigma-70 family RNA polymerase sigma factor n=1 Tax=Lysinibacillus capsici TaxID=2115968 RepID=UPI002152DF42|nr:sigma-70 family RNA polymerase sigma factor [Lysinibacillus capsici]MCR6525379.1 sigma-70 family RNA polymerase sigma factor [Lysinibacillus capsici]
MGKNNILSSSNIQCKIDENDLKRNPLIAGFLKDNDHYEHYEKAILNPTTENKNKVEEMFKSYYEKVRMNAYIFSLIKYYAIDFDKKVKKLNNRYVLTLDKPAINDEKVNLIDSLKSSIQFTTECKTLKDEITDEKTIRALNSLTDYQYKILDLIYVKSLTNKEIAALVNSTPQNISNIHKKALKKLKLNLLKEGEKNGKK